MLSRFLPLPPDLRIPLQTNTKESVQIRTVKCFFCLIGYVLDWGKIEISETVCQNYILLIYSKLNHA